ncbi:MAG TPA: histidinol-phosphate transaminase [Casimicrobiaceae bacterium]|nr:histidinol-phosphate transaminase [Casimicrobiaceae bacterium]
MNDPGRSLAKPVAEGDVRARVHSTIRSDVQALRAYDVAKASGLIKLDAMESPFALPEALRRRLAKRLASVPVNRYPDGPGDDVKDAIRRAMPVPDNAALILGNGSDELIQLITTAIAAPSACVLAPDPSFVMYRLNAMHNRVRFHGVALHDDFSLDEPAMLDAIEREGPALVWLAYPNNPTGNRFATASVERILARAPGLVVVDEAYYAFADDSFLPRVLDFQNLVVVRTVSKIGLAGLRLGYAAGHPAWIGELEKIRPPYNVNALTQAAVPIVLDAADVLAEHAAAIRAERHRLADALAARSDVRVFPTETNFVLVRVPDGDRWFAALRSARILVKNLGGYHPLLANCLRITVGSPEENDALLEAMRAIQ